MNQVSSDGQEWDSSYGLLGIWEGLRIKILRSCRDWFHLGLRPWKGLTKSLTMFLVVGNSVSRMKRLNFVDFLIHWGNKDKAFNCKTHRMLENFHETMCLSIDSHYHFVIKHQAFKVKVIAVPRNFLFKKSGLVRTRTINLTGNLSQQNKRNVYA